MHRRRFLSVLALFPIAADALEITAQTCPICGGKLIPAGSFKSDTNQPSANLVLWNGSYHGDFWPFHTEESLFCSKCFSAYSETFGKWERSSELKDSFFVPLSREIQEFPLSSARTKGLRTVYSQNFSGFDASGGRTESVAYWATDSMQLRTELQIYGDSRRLTIKFYTAPSAPNEVHITAETPNNSFRPTPHRRIGYVPTLR